MPYIAFNIPDRNEAGLETNYLNFFAQYLSEGPYPAGSLYSTRNLSWSDWYTGPLYNLQTIINLNNEENALATGVEYGFKDNQLAVARILKAYYFWFLTDIYGDIPYSQALKGTEELERAYDSQESIYTDLFKELTKAQAEFTAAINSGVLEAGENVTYQFIGGDPNNWNPWFEDYNNDNRNDYAISNTLGDFMLANNDPRVFIYGENLNSQVKTLAYGNNQAKNIPGAFSRVGNTLRADNTEAPIFTYAQVLFAKAEAAQRSWSMPEEARSTKQLYEDAIKASWEFWEVYDATAYATYIADSDIAYSAANGLERIIKQKWVNQYLNGFEAWTNWRRTGYPTLTPAPDATQTGGIPRRMGYPSAAKPLN